MTEARRSLLGGLLAEICAQTNHRESIKFDRSLRQCGADIETWAYREAIRDMCWRAERHWLRLSKGARA